MTTPEEAAQRHPRTRSPAGPEDASAYAGADASALSPAARVSRTGTHGILLCKNIQRHKPTIGNLMNFQLKNSNSFDHNLKTTYGIQKNSIFFENLRTILFHAT
jgi:hypothetical protein